MRCTRVHFAGALATGSTVTLPGDVSHHLLRVLRMRAGDEVVLFNGEPGDWSGRLIIRGKRDAAVEITGFTSRATESLLELGLVQGISRGQRMDYTLEKSVELGVARIQPVFMERTQAPPTGDRMARKLRHWRGVVAAAAAQCGRTRVPDLTEPLSFHAWLQSADITADHPHVLLDPHAERGPEGLERPASVTLLAGPEGGFAPRERDAAFAAGCSGIRLGPRILRTETAAVAALAVLQALYGDFR